MMQLSLIQSTVSLIAQVGISKQVSMIDMEIGLEIGQVGLVLVVHTHLNGIMTLLIRLKHQNTLVVHIAVR